MAKYLLIYQGGGGMAASEEEQAQVMAAWNGWFEQLGAAVVDIGNPTAAVKRISPGGVVSDEPAGPSGYSLITAADLDAAVALARGCPVLLAGGTVQVAETIEM